MVSHLPTPTRKNRAYCGPVTAGSTFLGCGGKALKMRDVVPKKSI
jgi:hypothetical protein